MERLRLLRDRRAIAGLRWRVAAGKAPEHNQSKERLVGPHRRTSVELADRYVST